MSVRNQYLPELARARAKLEQLAAAHARRVKFTTADFGGTRLEADTARILAYRDADYAAYKKSLKPGQSPIPINQFRAIAPFGSSYHNYGAAFDASPTSIDGIDITNAARTGGALGSTAAIWRSDPKKAERLYQEAQDVLDTLAGAAGLRSGDSFNDEPHFELPITLATARAMWGNFQETGSSSGTSGGSGAAGSGSSSSPTSATTRDTKGAAIVELVGGLAVIGALIAIVKRIAG